MSTSVIISLPILSLLVIIQSAIISRFTLLRGCADIVLLTVIAWALLDLDDSAWFWAIFGGLFVNFVSALPLFIPLISYVLSVGFTKLVRQRIGQIPYLAMVISSICGTLISLGISWISLVFTGNPIAFYQAMNIIILPSLLLNVFLSIVVYFLISGLAEKIYPEEIKI